MTSRGFEENSPAKKRKVQEDFKDYQREYTLNCRWRGLVDAKLDAAAPYYFFLSRIQDSLETYDEDLTITFPELLDKSLGELEYSVHINFMVEIPWLLAQYAVNDIVNPPMTILYGVEDEEFDKIPSYLKLTTIFIKTSTYFGHHHTKMSIFYYKDKSVRFAVYTANLIESDWENRTQGIWISPKCPYLGDDVPANYGESETLFKVDVLRYLNSYHQPDLREWLVRIQKCNCSAIRVCFVASIPGDHTDKLWGHTKLSKILKENSSSSDTSTWDLVAQISSIGSLGPRSDSWLLGEFADSLQEKTTGGNATVKVIYPSFENVKQSHDELLGGACLPYSSSTHKKQTWLQNYVLKKKESGASTAFMDRIQWKSDHRHRSRAVPHIKTYTKMSPDGKNIAWFLLSSANLSKAAWGKFQKSRALKILSYEAGVLFLPKFLISKDVFTIKKGGEVTPDKEEFPLPYDSPLTPYRPTDVIFQHGKP